MLTVGEAVEKSAAYLEGKRVDSPRLNAEILLAALLNCDRLRLHMDWKKPLTELEISGYREFIRRRGQLREPPERILGKREFYGRNFRVTADTFSPRQETEGLVERALKILRSDPLYESHSKIFEVGTGTGAIIITLAAESDAHEFHASDVSDGAITTAKDNAAAHHVAARIHFHEGDCFAGYGGTLGMIVSNPPYIKREDISDLPPEVKDFDPRPALDGGLDGLDVVRKIASHGASLLSHSGWVLLEIGEDQKEQAALVFEETGMFSNVSVERDLEGRHRYLLAQRNEDSFTEPQTDDIIDDWIS